MCASVCAADARNRGRISSEVAYPRAVRPLALCSILAACGRLGFDGDDPLARPIPHLPDGLVWEDQRDVVLDGPLDTASLPVFDGIAVLQAETITVPEGATVTITGALPVVLLARGTIAVDGVLDAGASGTRPGPGARVSMAGAGDHPAGDVCDSGGGGGGHATPGAIGGGNTCAASGGSGGRIEGDDAITILAGGAAGGDGVSLACGIPAGGGGGGALQLSAGQKIIIRGQVLAGGGGGAGGPECGDGDAGAGGGGGAGGAIVLDADIVTIDGDVFAHGGGGGAGGNGLLENGPVGAGGAGSDGRSLAPAAGGLEPAPNAGRGGAGGTTTTPPGSSDVVEHNAGGGGGAVGRIVIVSPQG
jgi:hypothetical protein